MKENPEKKPVASKDELLIVSIVLLFVIVLIATQQPNALTVTDLVDFLIKLWGILVTIILTEDQR